MAQIRPFRGLRYNPAVVGDLGSVVAQPYDVISPEEQQRLYDLSEYNVVRLELAREDGGDRYAAAAATLGRWRRDGVLLREQAPAMYLTRHEFRHRGRALARTELTVALRLEPFGAGSVRPHENTRAGPKEDRLKLMKATHANISPLLFLYEDLWPVQETVQEAIRGIEPLEAVPPRGMEERFLTWPFINPMAIRVLQDAFEDQPLYVADGHHRYETALAYRDQALAESEPPPNPACDYVMATLVALSDPGILSLPYHRLLRNLDGAALARLRDRLESVCVEERHEMAGASAEEVAEAALDSLAQGGALFEVWGLAPGARSSLRLSGAEMVAAIAGARHSRAWAGLGATVFREAVLKPLLGVDEEEAERRGWLTLAKDAAEAVAQVNAGQAQIVFMPRAVPMDALKEVSDRGEKLPPKSTYFHPKLPAGLVINPLDGVV